MPKMIPLLWTISAIAIICFLVWFFTPEAKAQDVHYVSKIPDKQLDVTRLVSAIAAVENTAPHIVSHSGARSRYQLMESVWRKHSNLPFAVASAMTNEAMAESERVARKHVKWIIEELGKRDYTATPAMVGQVWAAGLTKWVEHRQSFEETQFGQRVGNIYFETSK